MESTTSLVKKLQSAKYATPSGITISFRQGDSFYWEPKTTSVIYCSVITDCNQLLLHELGHGLLGHGAYTKDIELISMERAAWERATKLAAEYSIPLSDDVIEDSLDTYRDWLHARSLCPYCAATGIQATEKTYQCLNCTKIWHVNEARTCGLRRYKTI